MTIKVFLILMLLWLTPAVPSVGAGEIFRWLDKSGEPHFTDNPAKIPPEYRDRAEVQTLPDLQVTEPIAPIGSIDQPAETDQEGHDEQWWRDQIQKWQSQKEALTLKLKEAEEKLARVQFENAYVYKTPETNELMQEIEKYKQEIREAQEMLETVLPDEARKAGAPPGWLR